MKTLSQIPRKISAKFCYGLESSNHFDDETTAPKFSEKNKKIVNSEQKTKLEKILATENKEADIKAAEKMAEDLLRTDPTVAEFTNKEGGFEVEAEMGRKTRAKDPIPNMVSLFFGNNKAFNSSQKEAENLIANIESDDRFSNLLGSSEIDDYDIAA